LSKEIIYQSIWNWIQHYYYKPTNKEGMAEEENENIAIIIIDKTVIRVGREKEKY
jgi:hypothetical protein